MAEPEKTEVEHLREENERLTKERDSYRLELTTYLAEAEDLLSSKLKLLANELSDKVQTEFYSRLRQGIWIVGVLLVLASLGGYVSLSDLAKNEIDAAIDKRTADFNALREETLKQVVDLQIKTGDALIEVNKQIAEMKESSAKARDIILETTKMWEAAKISTSHAESKGGMTGKVNASSDRTMAVMQCLKYGGVKDADVDLFVAVIQNNLDGVKAAVGRGGNPNVTVEQIENRHRDVIQKSCPKFLHD